MNLYLDAIAANILKVRRDLEPKGIETTAFAGVYGVYLHKKDEATFMGRFCHIKLKKNTLGISNQMHSPVDAERYHRNIENCDG